MTNRSNVWRAILELVLPRGCASCDKPDEVLCADCIDKLREYHTRSLLDSLLGATFACGIYQGGLRRAMLNWKDHGDEECNQTFLDAYDNLIDQARLIPVFHKLNAQLLIIPVPSSTFSMRKRGRRHLWPIAKGLERILVQRGIDARASNALSISRVFKKSVQTSTAGERAARLTERSIRGSRRKIQGKYILLVDDIVTTGTTMRRCAQAVHQAGGVVVAGLALAVTSNESGATA